MSLIQADETYAEDARAVTPYSCSPKSLIQGDESYAEDARAVTPHSNVSIESQGQVATSENVRSTELESELDIQEDDDESSIGLDQTAVDCRPRSSSLSFSPLPPRLSPVRMEAQVRQHILFGAPGGPAHALEHYRPSCFSSRPSSRSTSCASGAMSHRSTSSNRSSSSRSSKSKPNLRQVGNTISNGSFGRGSGNEHTKTRPLFKMGDLELRMERLNMQTQHNAAQLAHQREFLDDILQIVGTRGEGTAAA